jgi:hypothetical protein
MHQKTRNTIIPTGKIPLKFLLRTMANLIWDVDALAVIGAGQSILTGTSALSAAEFFAARINPPWGKAFYAADPGVFQFSSGHSPINGEGRVC